MNRTPRGGISRYGWRPDRAPEANRGAALTRHATLDPAHDPEECPFPIFTSSGTPPGDCWDNAVAESFFATLKVELVHDALWPTRAAARSAVFEYIEIFYNRQRRHSSLSFLSPLAFERQWHQQHRAA